MLYRLRDAEREVFEFTDEYGEPNRGRVHDTMNKCWWSGFRYGVAAAFTPALMAFVAGLLL